MSVIIKSNVPFSGNGYPSTFKQISTTVDAAFLEYKNRVLADGGVINDESATLDAISFMFDNNMVGKCNTFVSAKFGVKLDSGGGVERAYAIDGVDLVGMSFGDAPLPKIENDNFVFSHADVIRVGSILTTETPITAVFENNRFAWVLKVIDATDTTASPLVGLTNHQDFVLGPYVAHILCGSDSGGSYVFLRHISGAEFNPSATYWSTAGIYTNQIPMTVSYVFDGLAGRSYTYYDRNDAKSTAQSSTRDLAPLNETKFYIDFGGMWKSTTNKAFTKARVSTMLSLKDTTDDVASSCVRYVHAEL